MDKLNMQTPNLMEENFKKLQALFPGAVAETIGEDGKPRRTVDADVLRQLIDAAEGREERCQFRVHGVEQEAMSLSVTQVDSVAQSLNERFARLSRAPHIAHDTRERSLRGYLFHQYTDLLNL